MEHERKEGDAPQQSSLMQCGSKPSWPLCACMGTLLWRTRRRGACCARAGSTL